MLDYGIRVEGKPVIFASLDEAVKFFGRQVSFSLDYPSPMVEGLSLDFGVLRLRPDHKKRILEFYYAEVKRDYGKRRTSGVLNLGMSYTPQELNTLFAYFAGCISMQDANLRYTNHNISYLKIGDVVILDGLIPPSHKLSVPSLLSAVSTA